MTHGKTHTTHQCLQMHVWTFGPRDLSSGLSAGWGPSTQRVDQKQVSSVRDSGQQ